MGTPSQLSQCTRCGRPLAASSRFCDRCGTPIVASGQRVDPQPLRVGEVLDGQWRLEGKLGAGG
ncbi:MAG: zinc ribbon domain-containing protein, partial [Deltaproteobacteria bacterium]|nr:zinc ribbon domain-containing protein [Deltaproteobacteria bacterium]